MASERSKPICAPNGARIKGPLGPEILVIYYCKVTTQSPFCPKSKIDVSDPVGK